jgi:hypothetical protein
MTETLQSQLCAKYSSLFVLKDNITEPIGAYGIECGDGWYDIISSVCFSITQHEFSIQDRNKYLEQQNKTTIDYEPVRFTQIKEKFGALRIYYYGGDDYIRGLIRMAECWSLTSCEKCGEKGKPDKSSWIMTLCNNCKRK